MDIISLYHRIWYLSIEGCGLELVEVYLWEVGADVGGVASVDIVPSGAHTLYFRGIVELTKESLFKFGWSGA